MHLILGEKKLHMIFKSEGINKISNLKILHLISSIDPAGGGPIEGIKQLSKNFKKYNVEVTVCACDSPSAEYVIKKDYFFNLNVFGKTRFKYAFNIKELIWVFKNIKNYDLIIVNGLWDFGGVIALIASIIFKTEYYVFSHGMLGPWFRKNNFFKNLKKNIYWKLLQYHICKHAAGVVFTCKEEMIDARKSFSPYRVNECIVNYGVDSAPVNKEYLKSKFFNCYPNLRNKRLIVFLGRIHTTKACDLLIEAFSQIIDADNRLHLVMVGPDSMDWIAQLNDKAISLGIVDRISWLGMLTGDMKWASLYSAEVFCLPSHHENFGIAVAEALACGKLVLISNGVNIWEKIVESNAGFVSQPTIEGIKDNFRRWLSLSEDDFQVMSENALSCFNKNFYIDGANESLLKLFLENKEMS